MQVGTRGCGDGTRRRNGSRRERAAAAAASGITHRDVISYGTHNARLVTKSRRLSRKYPRRSYFGRGERTRLNVFAHFVRAVNGLPILVLESLCNVIMNAPSLCH